MRTSKAMLCPVCNFELEGSPRFCNKCGSKLELSPITAEAPPTEVSTDAFLGKVLGGRYTITKLLGEGGMGAVYLGEQNIGGTIRKVAVKTLHQHLSSDPKILQRFERECATVAELQHPNTIQLYDYGKTDDGILYMVMEFVQGESLASILEKRGWLDAERTRHILQQICDALGEAHGLGIVHRDLKPDNIVLTERAKDWVKVLDFGIAKRTEMQDKEEQKLTQQGTVLGTPPYMSPEQFTGKPIDARSDIYSIGIIVYEMLSGRLPFSANTPWEWATRHMTAEPEVLTTAPSGIAIPPVMAQAVMRALAKDPDHRFATTKEFYEAFAAGAAVAVPGMVAAAAATPSGGYLVTPFPQAGALSPPSGPVDQRGKTQMGDPSYNPSGQYGMPPYATPGGGVGAYPPSGPMGAFPAGGHYGTPAAGNVAFPVPAAIPPGPAQVEAKSGGGRGFLIFMLVLLGLASAGAVAIALTKKPIALLSTANDTPPPPIQVDPVASHADIAPTSAPSADPGLDTSVAPLNGSATPPPSTPPGKGEKADAGPGPSPSVAPTPTPSPTPTPTPAPTPTTPANDPPPCKKARALKAKNPTAPRLLKQLQTLEERCTAQGGSI